MWFILAIIFSVLCALIANSKNRNSGVAALCGFAFGIFALIYYIAVGEQKNN